MPAKILRTLLTFAAVVVAFQVYVLLAVPYLEPMLEVREQRGSTAKERAGGRKLGDKYQRLLAAYFPVDHWTQKRAPKVIKNGPGMLVLDEYKQHDGNHIELTRCALLFFPTPLQDGMNPPSDAIVVEAPEGASILFDDDFNPAGGELGKIVGGQLNGLVTIRSEMKQAGPEDDLFVQTSNLRLNGDRLETPDAVQFRLGPNQGQGTRLQIRLLSDEDGSSSTGIQFSGIRSLSVLENVECRFAMDAGLLTDSRAKPEKPNGQNSGEPIQIRCTGPFEFQLLGDEKDYVATFNDNVEVWQFNPTGTSDQMVCNRLSLEFLPEYAAGVDQPLDVSRRQRAEFGRLEPYLLEAVGEPVIMMSPSREVEARGLRVRITIPERKIALDGGNVELRSGANVIQAPAIFYTHPANVEIDAGTRLGNFHADGAGSLDFEPNPNKPNEVLHVDWQESVRLTREKGEPVLSINGRPRIAMQGRGELSADAMKIYLREIADDSTHTSTDDQPAEDSLWVFSGGGEGNKDQKSTTIIPDRLTAIGNVVIRSPQLAGRTHSLSAWFRYLPDEEPKGSSNDTSDGFTLPGGNANGESYAIEADQLQLEIALRGRRAEPMNLTCLGNVVFREARPANPTDAPMVLHGQRLIVSDLDSDAKRIAIHGDPGGGNQPARPAEMTARGVTLISPAVFIDEGANRAWIDGAGEAHVNLNHGLSGKRLSGKRLSGQQSTEPYPVKIRWQDGLNFNGRQVAVDGDVFIEGPENWLRCDQLIGTLTRKIEFGEGTGGIKPDVAQIDVRGNVVIDQRERDAGGLTAHHRMELEQLSINQQTGAIRGQGPGWLRSVHYGQQLDSLTSQGGASPTTSAADNSSLHFLRVKFVRGLTGNLHDRILTFQQRVQTVYGPVDSWEQELDINRPETLPPSAITLRSNELTVNEDPTARVLRRAGGVPIGRIESGAMGPVEMTAVGNVDIKGTSGDQQKFQAVANRASYSQQKDVFYLQGNATIYLWQQPRSPSSTPPQGMSARSILYNRTTGAIDFDGVKGMNYTPVPGANPPSKAARNPAQGRIR